MKPPACDPGDVAITMTFQRTVTTPLSLCLSPGVHPRHYPYPCMELSEVIRRTNPRHQNFPLERSS